MRIGELAERAGISAKAIRDYEQIGILTPPERNASGYRAFDERCTVLGIRRRWGRGATPRLAPTRRPGA